MVYVSEFLEIWVASIQTYAPGDNGFPKIILIGTHKDKLPVSCISRNGMPAVCITIVYTAK